MNQDEPKFRGKARLLRYIHDVHRQGNRRASPAAFHMTEADRSRPDDAHLSVNSTEVETENQIVAYFRQKFQDNKGGVATCNHQIQQYVNAGREFLDIRNNKTLPHWTFEYKNLDVPTFSHRQKSEVCPSHCGVDFVRRLNRLEETKFARRMASKPTFKVA